MKLLVTAGPTREFLDPVRFLSNRSTGKMGYAIAAAGAARGHAVHLISGPVAQEAPAGVLVTRVISAADMLEAVLAAFADCDALVMCAAVADWRPKRRSAQKLKKDVMDGVLELERTADILQAVSGLRRQDQVIVGFAAETENVNASAAGKLRRKGLDLVVANDVSRTDAGFEADTNAVSLVTGSGVVTLPLMTKREVAGHILDWVESASHPARGAGRERIGNRSR
jgi:phosphopantothenoylcysteine decarboxylase/phosphopantothenate--cysteine ligase